MSPFPFSSDTSDQVLQRRTREQELATPPLDAANLARYAPVQQAVIRPAYYTLPVETERDTRVRER